MVIISRPTDEYNKIVVDKKVLLFLFFFPSSSLFQSKQRKNSPLSCLSAECESFAASFSIRQSLCLSLQERRGEVLSE